MSEPVTVEAAGSQTSGGQTSAQRTSARGGTAGAPLLGIVGPSGSGKSSALKAGLLPALQHGVLPGSDAWVQVVMRPGAHPMRELSRAALAATGVTSARMDASYTAVQPFGPAGSSPPDWTV